MKNIFLSFLLIITSLLSFTAFSQTEDNQELLGLAGDNLDLYAVLNMFQQSKTIEDFEKSLNEEDDGINNLDLNKDDKVDFIKVTTKKEGEDFMFVLQDDISEKETQDVAVIMVTKDDDGKVSMQIVGDSELYGKDYVVEPSTKPSASVTANPAYTGDNPVTENVPATNTVVVVESTPIVKYVYSPVYVPYYPPYHYAYYPPYFRAFAVVAVGIYRHNNFYHHRGYHNTVVIHNHGHYNRYHASTRRTSVTVSHNNRYGNYNTARRTTRTTTTRANGATRASTTNRATTNRASTNRATTTNRASTNRASTNRATTTNRASTNRTNYSRSSGSRSRSNYSAPSRSSSYSGGSRARRGRG